MNEPATVASSDIPAAKSTGRQRMAYQGSLEATDPAASTSRLISVTVSKPRPKRMPRTEAKVSRYRRIVPARLLQYTTVLIVAEVLVDHGLVQRHALFSAQFDEVYQDDRVAYHDAGPCYEPDHGRCGEERVQEAMSGQDAHE